MDEKENNFDCAALVSLISCVRNEANLNAQLSWKALGRQLSFTGFLIVGLGLLYKSFGDVAVILIAAAGVISTVMLFFSARMNDRHASEYNNSCEHLESFLPDTIRPHAVMNTFNNKIKKKIKVSVRSKMLILTVVLTILWLAPMVFSGYRIYQNRFKKIKTRYQEVLPLQKGKITPKEQTIQPGMR